MIPSAVFTSGFRFPVSLLCVITMTTVLGLTVGPAAGTTSGTFTSSSTGAFTFTVPTGVQIVQGVVIGGAGANGDGNNGGHGCQATGSFNVANGDALQGFVGSVGTGPNQGGYHGGPGYGMNDFGAGGNGGESTLVSGLNSGGGGSASLLFDTVQGLGNSYNGIIAAGGGGGGGQASGPNGGSACSSNTASGGNGTGEYSAGGGSGATSLTTGGALGAGPNPGTNGTPFSSGAGGQGGLGGCGTSGVLGGGGGGGGASGGGGGGCDNYGANGGGGGAGFSYVSATTGVVAPSFQSSGSSPTVTINYISLTPITLSSMTVGSLYTATLSGTFGANTAVTGANAAWSVSPALPAGLALNSTTGVVSGTPTANSPATSYTFTAEELSGGLVVAKSAMTASFSINAAPGPPTSPLLTTTSLASSANPVTTGQPVTFTATVNGSNPIGTVAFFDNGAPLGNSALSSNDQASYTVTNLASGSHTITSTYGGNATNAASTSAPFNEQVNATSIITAGAPPSNPATSLFTLSSKLGTVLANEVRVTSSCTGATCAGLATLSVARIGPSQTYSHPPVAVASLTMTPNGQEQFVLDVTPFGRSVLAHVNSQSHFHVTLVVQFANNNRKVSAVYLSRP